MSTQLHQTFEAHRVPPLQLVWPSMTATAVFAGIHAFMYLGGAFATVGSAGVADTVYGQPLFVWSSVGAAVLLMGFAAYDMRRHSAPFWRVTRWLIGGMQLALLGALLAFLFRAAALL